MSFQGFTDKTIEYFLNISLDNTKSNFEANRALYNEHVKAPMRELYESLVPAMLELDPNICAKPSRCVSGAYNDARYVKANPMKTYMYLHFCAETGREDDVPGLFMDASYNGYRYGLQLYHRTTQGMTVLRDAVQKQKKAFFKIIRDVETAGFMLDGDDYKKDRFPAAERPLKTWLNKKSWLILKSGKPDDVFFSSDLTAKLSESFIALKDLYDFMTDALKEVQC